MDTFQRFSHRLRTEWLAAYCEDVKRRYDPSGFNGATINVAEADARDCMLAIDQRVVFDSGGGRYRASRSSAHEVLFWEGLKSKSPKPITLWLEPVITFAALARLHLKHQWPKESLGMQPKGWAFDFAAYELDRGEQLQILGEVKKSRAELNRLKNDLLALSGGAATDEIALNSVKKWQCLLKVKPSVVWLVGPNEESYAYAPSFENSGCTLQEINSSALTRGTV